MDGSLGNFHQFSGDTHGISLVVFIAWNIGRAHALYTDSFSFAAGCVCAGNSSGGFGESAGDQKELGKTRRSGRPDHDWNVFVGFVVQPASLCVKADPGRNRDMVCEALVRAV